MGKLDIGLRQARALCQMAYAERLDFISEGLPLILDSARGLWTACQQLQNQSREADILEGHAEEEAAKILILLDAVRCPPKLLPSKISNIVKWFYDHLARMIYAKAASWNAIHVTELRGYVERSRFAHYIEGDYGEYIMQNWEVFGRESKLYVDIEGRDDGTHAWNIPQGFPHRLSFHRIAALELAEAFSVLGIFTPAGLRAVAEVWGSLEFVDTQNSVDRERLTLQTLTRLHDEKLISEAATDGHVQRLYSHWQYPMYNFDFSLIPVTMEEIERQRNAITSSEMGDYY